MDGKPFTCIVWALVVILLTPTASWSLDGKTYTWVAGDGYWDTPGNWLPGDGPPLAFDKAVIDQGVTVTSDQGASVSQLAVGAADILLISEKEPCNLTATTGPLHPYWPITASSGSRIRPVGSGPLSSPGAKMSPSRAAASLFWVVTYPRIP